MGLYPIVIALETPEGAIPREYPSPLLLDFSFFLGQAAHTWGDIPCVSA